MDAIEIAARTDLARLYRLVAHFRMTDLIDTHISARLPGTNHFLINRYGVLFHEMQPQDLVRVDPDGEPLSRLPPGVQVNRAGFTIHSAVHMARHDLNCVVHTHTADGMAVSCQTDGLLPITQHALRFYQRLAYHDYEGVALDLDERARLVRDLGNHRAMILRNHGLLTGGRSVAEAFVNIWYLERACQAQVRAQSGGAALHRPSAQVCQHTARQFDGDDALSYCEQVWTAACRLVD